MHLEQLPSGSWRVTVRLAGERRRATARTKTEARRAGARLFADIEADTAARARRRKPGTRTVTLGELVELHLAQAGYAATTHADMTSIARRIPTTHTTLPVAELGAADLDRLYTDLTRAGWSPHRVHRVHELVSSALSRAVRWGWIPANPARSARPPSAATREVRPPDPAVLAELAAAIDNDPPFAAFIRLASVTGARRGELCGLQWGDVDLDQATVTIRRSVAVTTASGVVVKDTKTGAKGRRTVHIDPVTVTALRRLRAHDAERLLSVGLRHDSGSWVFSDRYGTEPWRPDRPTHRWTRLRNRLGHPEIRLHDLRHLVATELLAAGVDHAVVAERLGHSSPRTTLGVYGHARADRAREAADIIAERLCRA